MFTEVMALRGPADLPAYAAGKDLVPASIEICTPMASSTATVRKTSAVVGKKK